MHSVGKRKRNHSFIVYKLSINIRNQKVVYVNQLNEEVVYLSMFGINKKLWIMLKKLTKRVMVTIMTTYNGNKHVWIMLQ